MVDIFAFVETIFNRNFEDISPSTKVWAGMPCETSLWVLEYDAIHVALVGPIKPSLH